MGVNIHWFRKGLRLHDNPSLLRAVEAASSQASDCSSSLVPLFILDPSFMNPARVGDNRMGFYLGCLQKLDASLRLRGSRLVIAQGRPDDVFAALFDATSTLGEVSLLTWEEDTEPYAVHRDASIQTKARARGVEVMTSTSHTLYPMHTLIKKFPNSTPPLTMSAFTKGVDALGAPDMTSPDLPTKMPALPDEMSKAFSHQQLHNKGDGGDVSTDGELSTVDLFGISFYNRVPKLSDELLVECGYSIDKFTTPFPPGEEEALERLKHYLKDAKRVASFEKPKTNPTSLAPDTTALSPYLKTGALSVKRFYWDLQTVLKKEKQYTKPPVSLVGQLLWREFYYLVGTFTDNYDRMDGNRICRNIGWDVDDEAEALHQQWEAGKTGYPAVDAAMRQLHQEGWMHHLGRHLVACFLTRGDLWVHWEKGRETFDKLLLDADWSLNNGNWMWLSCSCFFYQYFRCYSPIAFFKKTDPHGKYIRKYVPELKMFPDKFIYNPWEAPLHLQRQWGCVIGKDYPKPIVDHAIVSKRNMARMKAAYDEDKKRLPSSAEVRPAGKGVKRFKSEPSAK